MATTNETALTEATSGRSIDSGRPDHTGRLRTVLRINAVFSTVTGAISLAAGGPVAEFLGVDQVWLIRLIGAGLLGFAALVLMVARSSEEQLDPGSRVVSFNDFGWVLATIVVLALGWLTTAGAVVMGLIGLVVLELGIAQLLARRKMLAAASGQFA